MSPELQYRVWPEQIHVLELVAGFADCSIDKDMMLPNAEVRRTPVAFSRPVLALDRSRVALAFTRDHKKSSPCGGT